MDLERNTAFKLKVGCKSNGALAYRNQGDVLSEDDILAVNLEADTKRRLKPTKNICHKKRVTIPRGSGDNAPVVTCAPAGVRGRIDCASDAECLSVSPPISREYSKVTDMNKNDICAVRERTVQKMIKSGDSGKGNPRNMCPVCSEFESLISNKDVHQNSRKHCTALLRSYFLHNDVSINYDAIPYSPTLDILKLNSPTLKAQRNKRNMYECTFTEENLEERMIARSGILLDFNCQLCDIELPDVTTWVKHINSSSHNQIIAWSITELGLSEHASLYDILPIPRKYRSFSQREVSDHGRQTESLAHKRCHEDNVARVHEHKVSCSGDSSEPPRKVTRQDSSPKLTKNKRDLPKTVSNVVEKIKSPQKEKLKFSNRSESINMTINEYVGGNNNSEQYKCGSLVALRCMNRSESCPDRVLSTIVDKNNINNNADNNNEQENALSKTCSIDTTQACSKLQTKEKKIETTCFDSDTLLLLEEVWKTDTGSQSSTDENQRKSHKLNGKKKKVPTATLR